MPAKEVWADFKELPKRTGPAKHNSGVGFTVKFNVWECPHCLQHIEAQILGGQDRKAKTCARHFWGAENPCPDRPANDLRGKRGEKPVKTPSSKRPREEPKPLSGLVTIYALIDLLLLKPIYTGKTVDAHRRLRQHTSDSSSCRLVAQFVNKHGRSRVGIRPLVRCKAEDADTNESFYIIKNNTMFPNGLNLRHGSKAGDEPDGVHTMAAFNNPSLSNTNNAHMLVDHQKTVESVDCDLACTAAAWADVAAMCSTCDDDDSSEFSEEDESSGGLLLLK